MSLCDLVISESSVFSSMAPIKVCDSCVFFICAEQTCETGGIHQDKEVSVSVLVLHSVFPELLRHPEHHHVDISWESS